MNSDSSNPRDLSIRTVRADDLDRVIKLLNREVMGGVNIFRFAPLDAEAARRWWKLHGSGRYQALVAEHPRTPGEHPGTPGEYPRDRDTGSPQVVGWAAFAPHSAYEGYDRTAEISVWVDAPFRGQGIGKVLMRALLATCHERNLRTIVSRIEASNLASLRLHDSIGFTHVGVLKDVGEKFGRSLDVVLMQYRAAT
ncbi:MAG: N-acyltransferase YncA [Planctomycetota bacterium]